MKNLFSYPKKLKTEYEMQYLNDGIAMKRSTEVKKENFWGIGKEVRRAIIQRQTAVT